MLFISLKTMDNNFQLDTKPEPPDLTPLIDVIFILIVFFLLTSSIQDKIIEIDLPGSTEAENDKIKNELEELCGHFKRKKIYVTGLQLETLDFTHPQNLIHIPDFQSFKKHLFDMI